MTFKLYAGVSIVRDKFRVGEGATARCFSDVLASRIEWLNNGVVMASATSSTQQLDLVFSLVNDSIHNQVFICRVTGMDLEELRQNFTVKVNGRLSMHIGINNVLMQSV